MSARRVAPRFLPLLALLVAGCGGVPAWTATPAELPSLEQRLATLPSDLEARLHVAGIHWQSGNRQQARIVLSDGLSHHPGHPSLLALEARAAHLSGDPLAARSAYIEGAARAAGTALSAVLAQNAEDIGPTSAPALAQLLVTGTSSFDHGGSSLETAAIVPLVPAGSIGDSESVGTALTEVLIHDLRRVEPFSVIDRSLTAEVSSFLGRIPHGEEGRNAVTRVAALLSVGHVVWGTFEPNGEGGMTVRLSGLRMETDFGVISEHEFDVPANDPASIRARLAEGAWTLMVGGPPSSAMLNDFVTRPRLTLQDLEAFGAAIRQADDQEHAEAADALRTLSQRLDDPDAVRLLADREERLASIFAGTSLGLEPEAIGLARQMRAMSALRAGTDVGPRPRSPSVGEMFGQDRLGFQHLADFIIRVGSGS